MQDKFIQLKEQLSNSIIGQHKLIDSLLIALLTGGHILVEGAPGLAKTRAVKSLADRIEGDFQRIQFTPDLLPADITGTEIYRSETAEFVFQQGPIFHNIVLADEINRAPAKVQSALLEGMAERQVSVGRKTFKLPELFLVMATQNPLEQEGTYPLPEAQLDRFLMHVNVGYPDKEAEHQILNLSLNEASGREENQELEVLDQATIFAARKSLMQMHMADAVEEYIVQLVLATRTPEKYSEELTSWISYGASPRATFALAVAARAVAWLDDRDYVTPADVQSIAHDCLRHRVLLSYEAQAQEHDINFVLDQLLLQVPVV